MIKVRVRVVAILCAVVGIPGFVSAQPYAICMQHCVPEFGFSDCHGLPAYCGNTSDPSNYAVCMQHCIPEFGFSDCHELPTYCNYAVLPTYPACMEYCVPEYGFDDCNGLPKYCSDLQ